MQPTAASPSPDARLTIRRLHHHKRFAFTDFLNACRHLPADQLNQPFHIGMGSLIATAAHCLAADLVWIEALEGNQHQPLPTPEDWPDLHAIDQQRPAIDQRWDAYIDRLTPAALAANITRTSAATGRTYTITALDICLHVATHQAHTIAQGRNMLRTLGIPELSRNDLVFWAIDRPL